MHYLVSKLFRAYGLYNKDIEAAQELFTKRFQSSFELTGYITTLGLKRHSFLLLFQSSFELTGYITLKDIKK